jgi:hypothetical protein
MRRDYGLIVLAAVWRAKGLVDVVDDLKRMNDELRHENDALTADQLRLKLLEGRCAELEAEVAMMGEDAASVPPFPSPPSPSLLHMCTNGKLTVLCISLFRK